MRTPVMPAGFFIENRKELLTGVEADSLVLIQSAPEMIRNSDTLHSWRQDSNFFYFTGIDYPNCALLLIPNGNGKAEEILFIPTVDQEKEKWNGKMLSIDRAREISGIKKIQNIEALLPTFFRVQKWREKLFAEVNDFFPYQPLTSQHLFLDDLRRRLPGLRIKKLAFLTMPIRTRKKPDEIIQIKKSLTIIQNALESTMKKLKPGLMEYQVEAELMYHYLNNGCKRQGFETIAAGGKNATVLHYVDNADKLKEGDLILIDTGGEFAMYSGDITRVYPVNGKFSQRQRQCYQAVLDVNKHFIKELKPGSSWNQLYEKASEIIGDIYTQHGFVDDPANYKKVCFHRIGHFLGLDIHDTGRLDIPMEPGAVITVEPGLYLADEGIGVRIEDNVLLTEDGAEVLSASIPKEIDDIETIMAKKN